MINTMIDPIWFETIVLAIVVLVILTTRKIRTAYRITSGIFAGLLVLVGAGLYIWDSQIPREVFHATARIQGQG